MVPCCAAAASYSGDGVLHTLPGAAVAGAAPPQLCQLPILLAGPYAHAGPAPALPCPALLCPSLPCPALPRPALPCPAPPRPALPCAALPSPALLLAPAAAIATPAVLPCLLDANWGFVLLH